ncbi:MAG: dTMP kinase, partial [Persicimonas sp.]
VPALRGGFVVLADRYVYTLIARAAVRRIDHDYLENVYDFAVEPDLAFRLDVPPQTSFERLFENQQSINYWEAGGDLDLSQNLYESFVDYQDMLRAEFDRLEASVAFETVDADASVRQVNQELREAIGEFLAIEDCSYEPSDEFLPIWHK